MRQAGRYLRARPELLVLAAIVVAIPLLPRATPPGGILGIGIVSGAFVALQAAGMILVYRSNRIINFAQVQLGVVAASLFTALVQYQPLLRAYTAVCPGCKLTRTLVNVNYWVAMALGLGLSVLVSFAIYFFVIKRFARAPRLIVTVATIFIIELLGGIQGVIPRLLSTGDQRLNGNQLQTPGLPFDWHFEWGPVTFHAPDVLVVLVAAVAVVGLTAYFRLSRTGTALRAAGEDPGRAESLGVRVATLNGRAWMFAGLLSGAAAILVATTSAPSGEAGLDVQSTMRILAVAVIARMASMPLAAVAAVVIGMLFQSVLWAYGSNVFLDAVLLGVITAVLLVQNYRVPPELEQASGWRAVREIRPIPKELRSLGVVRGWMVAGAVLAALGLVGLPWLLSPSQINLAAVAVIYAVVGLSLLIVTGWIGHISLGQFALAAVGAYVAAASGLPFALALTAGAAAGAVAAVAVGIPALRLRGLHLAVISLAFALAVPVVLLHPTYFGKHLPDTLRRPAFFGLDLDEQRTFYYFALAVLALAVAAMAGLRRSRTARALLAGRDNEAAARSFGVNLVRARLGAYAMAGGVAGLAGALFAYHQYGVRPSGFPPEASVTIFLMAVIGGLGAISGPLIGALYLGTLIVLSASPLVQFLATGAGGLALLLFIPGGLSQLVFGMRDALLRRLAVRRGIFVPSLVTDASLDPRRRGRAPIAPKARPGGTPVRVPRRYRIGGQWALEPDDLGRETAVDPSLEAAAHRAAAQPVEEPVGG